MKTQHIKLTLLSFFLGTFAYANTHGDFGLGVILGEPTGLSAKYNMDDSQSLDAGLGWSFTNDGKFHFHADYLRYVRSIFSIESAPFDLHYGLGARVKNEDSKDKNRTFFGARLPVGLDYNFKDAPVELFIEAAFVFDVAPETRADFNAGIGGRWFF